MSGFEDFSESSFMYSMKHTYYMQNNKMLPVILYLFRLYVNNLLQWLCCLFWRLNPWLGTKQYFFLFFLFSFYKIMFQDQTRCSNINSKQKQIGHKQFRFSILYSTGKILCHTIWFTMCGRILNINFSRNNVLDFFQH